jgi:hypothetical protein
MHDHIQKLADYAAPATWVTWVITHLIPSHNVLQDVALIAAIFASSAAGLFHITKWIRMLRTNREDDPS